MKHIIHHVVLPSLYYCLSFAFFFLVRVGSAQSALAPVNVGVVLDTDSVLAEMSLRAMNISLSEFYSSHSSYKTRLVLNVRDSQNSVVGAAAAALYLVKNKKIHAILGPGTSTQAHFLINLGNESQVPIISFSATSPLLTSLRSPYFVRATHNDSSQVHAIGAIIETFRWREVVPVYVDNEFGEGILPYLVDALQEINVRIRYRSVISPFASNNQIREELYKLMTMPSRVFVVHMLPDLGSRLFAKAKEIGMMAEGYAWIVTNGMADLMSLVEKSNLESMQGVLAVKTYLPKSKELMYFEAQWRRKFQEGELNNFGYWAYDATTALAMAVEKVSSKNNGFNKTKTIIDGTDLGEFSVSVSGPKLLQALSSIRFRGVGGEFRLNSGQREVSTFKIINVDDSGERTIGFWTPRKGLVKKLRSDSVDVYSSRNSRLRPIIWPGDTNSVPKGWEIPTNMKKLRIAVPKKAGFSDFVKVIGDPLTNTTTVTGFCIDVFDAVMKLMPYAVPYEYIPFETSNGEPAGSYNEMVYQVFLGEYDAAVGDTTILANRSQYVDFTLPYAETGIAFVVPVKDEKEKGALAISKPLTLRLWLVTVAFFFYIALLVWIFECRSNEDLKGLNKWEQFATILCFAFSTMFFAHREPERNSICTRVLVVFWCFVVLILTQCYTATLTTLLTVQQLRPTVASVDALIKSEMNIGYQTGSFVFERLKQMGVHESRLRTYGSPAELHELFLNTSRNGGIDAAFDEVVYINLFMGQYCSEYTMIEPKYKADGLGFAFPVGSPLVPDVSRQILNVTEGEKMEEIQNAWFKKRAACPDASASPSSTRLDLESFKALFGIVFVVSIFLLLGLLLYRRFHHPHDARASADWTRVQTATISSGATTTSSETATTSSGATTTSSEAASEAPQLRRAESLHQRKTSTSVRGMPESLLRHRSLSLRI